MRMRMRASQYSCRKTGDRKGLISDSSVNHHQLIGPEKTWSSVAPASDTHCHSHSGNDCRISAAASSAHALMSGGGTSPDSAAPARRSVHARSRVAGLARSDATMTRSIRQRQFVGGGAAAAPLTWGPVLGMVNACERATPPVTKGLPQPLVHVETVGGKGDENQREHAT